MAPISIWMRRQQQQHPHPHQPLNITKTSAVATAAAMLVVAVVMRLVLHVEGGVAVLLMHWRTIQKKWKACGKKCAGYQGPSLRSPSLLTATFISVLSNVTTPTLALHAVAMIQMIL